MSNYHKIEELRGFDNYEHREMLLRATLVVDHIFHVVDERLKPIPPLPESESEKQEEYHRVDQTVLAIIQSTCTSDVRSQIQHITSAKSAWATLKTLYGTYKYTFESKPAVYWALHTLRASDCKDLHRYVAKFRDYIYKLKRMGTTLDVDVQCVILANGLPEHLSSFVNFQYEIARSKEEPVDIDYVISRIISRGMLSNIDLKASANNSSKNPKQNDSNTSRGKNKDDICSVCGANRHPTKKCFYCQNEANAPEWWNFLNRKELDRLKSKRLGQ